MRILALDLATRLGWAYGDTSQDPVSGWQQLPKTGEDVGRFAVAYHDFMRSILPEADPEVIVMEEPMATTAGRSTLSTTLKLQGLCYHTELYGAMKGIPVRQVHSSAWKKSFCGTGRVSKKMRPYPPITACAALGWQVVDDNQADALALWVHSTRLLDPANSWRFDPLGRPQTMETTYA